MDYFKLDEIPMYSEAIRKEYVPGSPAVAWYADTETKLRHLVGLLSEALNMTLTPNYQERPNKQPKGRQNSVELKEYVLVGFIPENVKAGENIFIKLVFQDFNNFTCVFSIEVDINFKRSKEKYTQYRGGGLHTLKSREQLQQDTRWKITVDENFPTNWQDLVALILPKVKEDVEYLRTIRKQSPDQVLPKRENPKQNVMSSANSYSPLLNQILFGPPGTGKTYHTVNKAIAIIENAREEDLIKEGRPKLKKRFDDYVENGQIVFTTFHQSMSYEDFIEGIKPQTSGDQKVTYETLPGIFKKICTIAKDNWLDANRGVKEKLSFEDAFSKLKELWEENPNMLFPLRTEGKEFAILGFTKTSIRFKKANGGTDHTLSIATLRDYFYNTRDVRQTGIGIYYPGILRKLKEFQPDIIMEKEEKNYVLIIDEINRGNVSQIFGELITLIEEDKRLGKAEALEITLPYSDELFGVPPNLYIIGTMNTADRSVEALDTALRRRFSFVEMPPKSELIGTEGKLKATEGKLGDIDLVKVLQTINDRIEVLAGRDHLIGHSYFLKVDSEAALKETFFKNILPLLQEYFFGDYGKIGLVLGQGFVRVKRDINTNQVAFAKFAYEDTESLHRTVYELVPEADVNIRDAIKNLLGHG